MWFLTTNLSKMDGESLLPIVYIPVRQLNNAHGMLTPNVGIWSVSSLLGIISIFGADRRLLDPNTHDMMHVLDDEELVPSAMVYPGSTEEVQHIVRWANKYGIPIFPISMGRNCRISIFS